MQTEVHKSAIVSPKAEIAPGAVIGPYALIEDDVFVGEGTRVDAFASIKRYTRLGRNNHVHSYAMIGGEPQDLKFAGEVSWLEIGDDNDIREFTTLHRGTESGGGLTSIGDHNLIMAYVHIAHDCHVGSHVVMSNAATLAGHIEVQDGVIISGLSAVHQFARIGRKSFVGGMTGITRDLPPYMMAVGERAGVLGPNLVGLRRMGLPRETISAIRDAFKIIWLSKMTRQDALALVEEKYAAIPEVIEIVNFIRSSPRGVLGADKDAEAGEE